MKTGYCPTCKREVEIASGRCWICCHLFGYPVESAVLNEEASVAASSLSPATEGRNA